MDSAGLMDVGGASTREIAELIEETSWGKSLSWKATITLSRYLRVAQLRYGYRIFEEGEQGNFMAFLVSGSIDILKKGLDGTEHKIETIFAGKIIGEMSLMSGLGRSASAVASDACVLLVLKQTSFDRLKEEHPAEALEVVTQMAVDLSHWLRQTTGRLVEARQDLMTELVRS